MRREKRREGKRFGAPRVRARGGGDATLGCNITSARAQSANGKSRDRDSAFAVLSPRKGELNCGGPRRLRARKPRAERSQTRARHAACVAHASRRRSREPPERRGCASAPLSCGGLRCAAQIGRGGGLVWGFFEIESGRLDPGAGSPLRRLTWACAASQARQKGDRRVLTAGSKTASRSLGSLSTCAGARSANGESRSRDSLFTKWRFQNCESRDRDFRFRSSNFANAPSRDRDSRFAPGDLRAHITNRSGWRSGAWVENGELAAKGGSEASATRPSIAASSKA